MSVAALFMSTLAAVAAGQDVHMDSFEDDPLGSFPAGWTSRFGGGGTEVGSGFVSEGDHSLRMVGLPLSANENYTNAKFSFSGGMVTLACSILVEEFPQNSDGCAGASVGYHGPNWNASFGLTQSAAAGPLMISGTDIEAVTGRWYRFLLVADVDSGIGDLYVDGELVRGGFVLDSQSNPGDVRHLSVSIHSGCINTGQVISHFDALRIQGKQCLADMNGDDILDLNDVTGFVSAFLAGCP
ncbi:MAG: hypothetical protein H6810_10805 [Phycisphaeraceae bacterium]|nr:MAG: hypothetical protein H6810_10805 [Phycisphaeraceae bacterium]